MRNVKIIALSRLEEIERKLNECEIMAMKIKAVNFVNAQPFDYIHENYNVGELYKVEGIGYTILTSKTDKQIEFIVIMKLNNIWQEHWQDVDKHVTIQQGIYLDLYTGKEYTNEFIVKAFEPSYFQAIGNEDLIIKGKIWRQFQAVS